MRKLAGMLLVALVCTGCFQTVEKTGNNKSEGESLRKPILEDLEITSCVLDARDPEAVTVCWEGTLLDASLIEGKTIKVKLWVHDGSVKKFRYARKASVKIDGQCVTIMHTFDQKRSKMIVEESEKDLNQASSVWLTFFNPNGVWASVDESLLDTAVLDGCTIGNHPGRGSAFLAELN